MELAMTVSGAIRTLPAASVLALSPWEKWAAARRLSTANGADAALDYWFLVAAVIALAILIGLLYQVSKRRKPPVKDLSRELFAEYALRRGLSPRERQILLAIVMRGGLLRSHDVFTSVDAFDRGANRLLAECLQARTAEENERLKSEVASLREKLGFQIQSAAAGSAAARKTSSREIPVGSTVRLTRRRDRNGVTIQGRIVRNDDIELAVDLETAVEAHSSDMWRVRYSYGLSVWEFDTNAASRGGTRLALNHSENVRFVNRRRFPRVAVSAAALIARFPFMCCPQTDGNAVAADEAAPEAPVFVPGELTELAGPGLRLEAPLEIRAGDRVLVAFRLSQMPTGENQAVARDEEDWVFEGVGQVRHWRSTSQGASIAVELTALSDPEIDTLVRITNQAVSRAARSQTPESAGAAQAADAQADHAVVGQEL